MIKEFLPYSTVRNDAIKLAYKIVQDGFVPDIIYCLLRGGSCMANVISEYFKVLQKKRGKKPVLFAAVVARSYTGVATADKVIIDGWTYEPKHLRAGDKILLIDDIFDTGRTINYLTKYLMEYAVPRADIKVVVHDFKTFTYKEKQEIQPDYYCRKFVIKSPEENRWIHYLSHELVGLTEQELQEHYYKGDPSIKQALEAIL